MCGFFGVLGLEHRNFTPEKEKMIFKLLRHRGPDDYQIWERPGYKLLFWRLSIVDRQGGKQPMSLPDRNKTVLFNGEIYNYKILRNELKIQGYHFQTDSDTEVILMAYQAWGVECFSRFEGMFAICIIDEDKETVLLVRDRLGVKPLYFLLNKDNFFIASEQKALLAYLQRSPELDRQAFNSYLVFQTVLGTRTLFRGISKIPPGNICEFSLRRKNLISTRRIQSFNKFHSFKNYDDYKLVLREIIIEQAKMALDTDLPICFHLSGGIDSNILVALCKHINPQRDFVCISSLLEGEKDPEWPFIKQSVEHHNIRLKLVEINADNFFDIFDDVIYYLDEPVGDPGVVAQFLVNRLGSGEAKIIYSGQGFDEMFFGYIRDLAAYILSLYGPEALDHNSDGYAKLSLNTRSFFSGWEYFLKSLTVKPVLSPTWALLSKLCRFNPFEFNTHLSDEFKEPLRNIIMDTYTELLNSTTSFHEFMLLAETRIQLPSLLHMEDRASMRYSLETRVPFCTASILDLAKNSRLEWKFYDGKPKGILRNIFSDILPPSIVNRYQKIGRPIPFRKWLKTDKGKRYLQDLEDKRSLFKDLMKIDFVEYALSHPNPYDRSAWAALSLAKWIHLYKVKI